MLTAAFVSVPLLSGPVTAIAAPPPNPTDTEVSQAQAAEDAAAAEVGRLAAMVTQAQSDLAALHTAAEIAIEAHHQADEELAAATTLAVETEAAAAQAAAEVGVAEQDIAAFARGSYIQGSTLDSAFVLLSSDGPAQLIERAGLLEAVSASHVDVLSQVRLAKVAQANADSAARQAVLDREAAEAAAAAAMATATAEADRASEQAAALEAQQANYQVQLEQAQVALLGVEGARSAYEQWAAEEAARQAEEERRAE
ncbi:MAG: M23 family peptidase, partial [Geodermatophilaceae bacterium]|nr:M23 family peptidase [Geodermatophilaceae bacterium]